MKEISKEEIKKLVDAGKIKNSKRGYIDAHRKDADGNPHLVGYYKTLHGRHRYIQDEYVDIARNLK